MTPYRPSPAETSAMYSSVPPKLPPFSLMWTTDANDTPARRRVGPTDRAGMALT